MKSDSNLEVIYDLLFSAIGLKCTTFNIIFYFFIYIGGVYFLHNRLKSPTYSMHTGNPVTCENNLTNSTGISN